MAKSPNVFRKKSEVWCGRDIILMCGGFGGPPLGKFSKINPYFLQSEAYCGVFIKETL